MLLLAGTANAAALLLSLVVVKATGLLIFSFRSLSLLGKTTISLHRRFVRIGSSIPWKLVGACKGQQLRRGRSREEVVVGEHSVVVLAAPYLFSGKSDFEKALVQKRDAAVFNCKCLSVRTQRILCGLDCEGDFGRGSLNLKSDLE
jgi:hypothetical protein